MSGVRRYFLLFVFLAALSLVAVVGLVAWLQDETAPYTLLSSAYEKRGRKTEAAAALEEAKRVKGIQ